MLINDEEVFKSDPYKSGMFKADPYHAKRDLSARLVVVLDGQYPRRGLKLIAQPSRAVCRHQVHELIITDQDVEPGNTVDPIAYLGFAEFEQGGVMVAGDQVVIEGQVVGSVAGFDETHMPNHLNIVIRGEMRSGRQRQLQLGQEVKFIKPMAEK